MSRNKLLLSLTSSCLLLVSFYWISWLAFFSFIPLFFACYPGSDKSETDESNHAFKYGFASGFVFAAGLMFWVLVVSAPMRGWLWLGVFLLFMYFGAFFGFSIWVSSRFRCFPLIPVIWTSVEFLRGLFPEIGFPWGSIGYTIIPYLKLVQFAEFVGLPGLTFFVLLINTLLFYAIKNVGNRRTCRGNCSYLPFYAAIIIVLAIWLQGSIALKRLGVRGQNPQLSTLKIGIVQPNISPEMKRSGELDYRLSLLYRLSKKARDCDLIVWPESAISGYFNLGNLESRVVKIVDSLNIPILMGGARLDFDEKPISAKQKSRFSGTRIYNSCFFIVPREGVKGIYDKIYLVPFSEHLPFADMFPRLQKLQFGQGNFSQGNEYKVFELNVRSKSSQLATCNSQLTKFSPLICFESIFSRISRKFVRNGAEFLVNITDDCWFGHTPGPYQHAQQAILRAIEYRVPLVRCGNTGISYFVEPSGEVKSATDIFTRRVIVKEIHCGSDTTSCVRTFYAKWGDWFAWLLVGMAFLFCIVTPVRKAF